MRFYRLGYVYFLFFFLFLSFSLSLSILFPFSRSYKLIVRLFYHLRFLLFFFLFVQIKTPVRLCVSFSHFFFVFLILSFLSFVGDTLIPTEKHTHTHTTYLCTRIEGFHDSVISDYTQTRTSVCLDVRGIVRTRLGERSLSVSRRNAGLRYIYETQRIFRCGAIVKMKLIVFRNDA